MEEIDYTNTLDLIIDIQSSISKEKERIERECVKAPYHINLFDELHVNENANSRILAKLFQHTSEKGEYDILISFVEYLMEHTQNGSSLSNIKILEPAITYEQGRIDIWVRDRKSGYAFIIENKIYDAQDQEAQLARYIEKTITDNFEQNNIFVIYMPSIPSEPDDQTWIYKNHNYKEEYQDRYFIISFRDDILNWLKYDIEPNIRQKDILLSSAIRQYIDYLEGLFGQRINDKRNFFDMEKKIKTILAEKLSLEMYSNTERVEELSKSIGEVRQILDALEEMRMAQMSANICEYLKEKTTINILEGCRYSKFSFLIDGIEFYLYIGRDSKFYCQLQRRDSVDITSNSSKKVFDACKDVLIKHTDSQKDRMWKYVNDSVEAYVVLRNVIDKVLELL